MPGHLLALGRRLGHHHSVAPHSTVFLDADIHGNNLPDRALCLSFDDGPGDTAAADGAPGPRTRELAQYLSEQHISATFFMCGMHISQFPDLPRLLQDLGHTIGNHTQTHRNLRAVAPDEAVREIRETYRLLRDLGIATPMPFRAPYGEFPSGLAALLNVDPELSRGHCGPIHWEIDGQDWDHWQRRASAEECAHAYFVEIQKQRAGIVLMHDSTADHVEFQLGNRTYHTVRLLVPRLRDAGYSFLPLAEAIRY